MQTHIRETRDTKLYYYIPAMLALFRDMGMACRTIVIRPITINLVSISIGFCVGVPDRRG